MSEWIVCGYGFLKKRLVSEFILQSFWFSIFSSKLSSIQNRRKMEWLYLPDWHENRRKRVDLEKECVSWRVGPHVRDDSWSTSIQLPSRLNDSLFGTNRHSIPPWPEGPWEWRFQACRNWKEQSGGEVEGCPQIQREQSNRTRAALLWEMVEPWWFQSNLLLIQRPLLWKR